MQSQPLYTLGLGQNVSVYHLLKMITLLISISLFSPAFQNKTKQCTNHPLALNNSKRQQCLELSEMKYRAVRYQYSSGIMVHFDTLHEFPIECCALDIKEGAVMYYHFF